MVAGDAEDQKMARVERVVYRSGFVAHLEEAKRLPAITLEAAELPEDVVAVVDAHLLDLGGTYGVPRQETRSSTTSYASSTTRATSRSSSTTAPSSCSSPIARR